MPDEERFLVTGGLGCLGAWTCKRLADEGTPIWVYDAGTNPHRLRLVMSEESRAAYVRLVPGDITDLEHLRRVIEANGITHIIHLAALQVPAVRADPLLGAQVNVAGTAALLEAAHRSGQVRGLAYASSVAAYGPPELYAAGPPPPNAPMRPDTLYGVFKRTGEEMARIFWQDHGLASIGLRPYIIYGPGRDQGMTSTPTKAMLAAVFGRPYTITFGGSYVYQHAEDAARAFIQAARAARPGADVYDLGGSFVDMATLIQAIQAAVPESAGRLTFTDRRLPFPPEMDGSRLDDAIGEVGWRPLKEGVAQTIRHFQAATQAGELDVEYILAS
jgi:nucleoside-diphosphate-sugar epimerase